MSKYIESKLNPDGRTYDHSEVIEAHKKGARVEWYCWHQWKPCAPLWQTITKYRAVIEDKPTVNDSNAKDLLIVPSVNLAAHIRDKFQSGNDIPVERITLTRAEVNEVFPGLLK
ncbi:hypothetical protein [Advenella mimigardefordensis]|uniref:hypothetical protein n=1 Tax=Advenella mimigardefordensis TaxID=302406 RepID=UPI00046CC206|nr:hypothetical protein [Advenella mimigardefordensis]